MYIEFAVFAVFAFFYSTVAAGLERTPVSGPVIFIAAGLLFGPMGIGWINGDLSNDNLRVLADLTLALVLFIDAANANLGILKVHRGIPQRMLLIGLPGVILLGAALAWLLFGELTFYEVAILAVILAATDAALGKAVITNKAVPTRVREGLNLESGLNDGICVPILFVFIALAEGGSAAEEGGTALALRLFVQEIGIGLAVGLGMAALGAWVMRVGKERGWISPIWAQVPVIALAIGSFTVAQSLHGSGYIAAFTGGLLFGRLAGKATHKLVFAAEGIAELLAMLTWFAFGAAVLGDTFKFFSWQVVAYAVLSLTVIRMLPIVLSLSGTGERTETKLFMGWFGPRGLASIVFLIIVWNKGLPGAGLLAAVVVCTVFLSALAHGISANPLSRAFSARIQRLNGNGSPEQGSE